MPQRPAIYRPQPTKRQPDTRPNSAERGYSARWKAARLSFLAENPLCARCKARGLVVEATVVDHAIPHRGDAALFWDEANWQSLCKPCHDRKTATEDRTSHRS